MRRKKTSTRTLPASCPLRYNEGMKQRVAAFDIDGTIFRSSLLIELTEALIDEGVFPARLKKEYEREYENWLNRKDSYDRYIAKLIGVFDESIRGVRQDVFMRVAKRVAAFHAGRVYRYTRDLIRDLRARGYYLLAISHSPKYVVDAFATRMGFHKAYGRMLEIDARGRFTGVTMHEDTIMDKARTLLRAVQKEHLTLAHSVGVGDSESDIPFLELVAHPIAFNPNTILFRHAKRKKWRIVVERKDVIYELQ